MDCLGEWKVDGEYFQDFYALEETQYIFWIKKK